VDQRWLFLVNVAKEPVALQHDKKHELFRRYRLKKEEEEEGRSRMGHDERGDSRFLSATTTTAAEANDFEYGLCLCCADCDVCLCAWCCPCVQFGRNCADLSQDDPASCCC
jgi:hypothetical protein